MKKIALLLSVFIFTTACQDVIELDLNTAAARLVIDARIELNEDGSTTTNVLLTRSAGFYVETVTTVADAGVTITDNSTGTVYNLTHSANGNYSTTALSVQANVTYTLDIIDGAQTYTATQTLVATVPIVNVEQEALTGLGELVRITAFYNDPAGLGDRYLFEYKDADNFQTDIGDDEFFDGNLAPTIFFIDDLQPDTPAVIRIKGIDDNAFKFYESLLQQSGDGGPGGGPFGTPPATVRGNIINTNDSSRYPFGYFRISQVFEVSYVST